MVPLEVTPLEHFRPSDGVSTIMVLVQRTDNTDHGKVKVRMPGYNAHDSRGSAGFSHSGGSNGSSDSVGSATSSLSNVHLVVLRYFHYSVFLYFHTE